jgi:hypothetical protein
MPLKRTKLSRAGGPAKVNKTDMRVPYKPNMAKQATAKPRPTTPAYGGTREQLNPVKSPAPRKPKGPAKRPITADDGFNPDGTPLNPTPKPTRPGTKKPGTGKPGVRPPKGFKKPGAGKPGGMYAQVTVPAGPKGWYFGSPNPNSPLFGPGGQIYDRKTGQVVPNPLPGGKLVGGGTRMRRPKSFPKA